MLRSLIEHVLMVVIAAVMSLILIYAFDEWYRGAEENRAHRRERRARKHHNHSRYE